MSRSHIHREGAKPSTKKDPALAGLLPLLLSLFFACDGEAPHEGTPMEKGGPAARFLLEERSWGRELFVLRGEKRDDTLCYRLIERGEKVPEKDGSSDGDIEVPVERIACLSSTHVGMLKELGEAERVVAFSSIEHLFDPALRKAMKAGRIRSVGSERMIDVEQIIEAGSELVLGDGMNGSGQGRTEQLEDAGIPVLHVLEWQETHPLERLEWLRVFAVLVGKEERADSLVRTRRERYRSIARKLGDPDQRPLVLCNALHKGTWYTPGGESFMVRLIEDAGGRHPWDDASTGGVARDLEEVMAKAGNADIWLNPGGARNISELKERDERVNRIHAFRQGKVFNHDRRKAPSRGNDYWESAVARPDLVLADIAHILHPERFPEHELVYYRRLPKGSEL